MTHVAYEWSGDTFCEEDIVSALTDHEPWSEWLEIGNVPRAGMAEQDLDEIAVFFGINRRSKADLKKNGFPVKLKELPDPPSICAGCLQWFT